MNQLRREYLYHIFVIKECLVRIVGQHFPKELISLIVSFYKFIRISCGANHMILTVNDKIYACGDNFYGQLGLGVATSDRINYPYELKHYKLTGPINSIICGGLHTICQTDNKIYVWGNNCNGELGLGHTVICRIPHEFICSKLTEPIKTFSCGMYHTIAVVKSDQYMYVWGYNLMGQLGLGNHVSVSTPRKLDLGKSIMSVSCGEVHTVCLAKNTYNSEQIYVWGGNKNGQLGLGHTINQNSPQKLDFIPRVVAIACGAFHTMALTVQGDIYAWGDNSYGQLGIGHRGNRSVPEKVTLNLLSGSKGNRGLGSMSIVCGGNHTIAVADNGKIYVWGCNEQGQLGLGDNVNRNTPCELSTVSNIVMINCGLGNTIALTRDDRIYVWGSNCYGQLGLGDFRDRNSPF